MKLHNYLPICLILVAFFTEKAKAVSLIQSQTIFIGFGASSLDLDGDSSPDLEFSIDFSITNPDTIVSAQPLGSSGIYATNDTAVSLFESQSVILSSLSFVNNPTEIIVGGVVSDALGNIIFDGFGGCSLDDFGNLSCSEEAPLNVIDLILVELESGVAVIDIDTSPVPLGSLVVNSRFIQNPLDDFTVISIPEPSILSFAVLGLGWLFSSGRKRT